MGKFPPLDDFQKDAISAFERGEIPFIIAPTGAGKTLPVYFAIRHFKPFGQVIYASPIKALTNQKFREFCQLGDTDDEEEGGDVGILTGDNKFNTYAPCIVATTECLCTALVKYDDIACVIFDEIHSMNNPDRSWAWVRLFYLLPKHINIIMISATVSNAERFAEWVSRRRGRPVRICRTYTRPVPLEYSTFYCVKESSYEKLPNANIIDSYNADFVDAKNTHNPLRSLESLGTIHTLNLLANRLRKTDRLPAIVFVFSRKRLEVCANKLDYQRENTNASEIDNIVYSMLHEMSQYKNYIMLPEYTMLLNLLRRGIGIHHSGMLPIFRELVELLFQKKLIDIIFATETFSVGINMPARTVVFTSLEKPSNDGVRSLLPYEFTQMAGRAGRRGIDKVGYVVVIGTSIPCDIINGQAQQIDLTLRITKRIVFEFICNGEIPELEDIENMQRCADKEERLKHLIAEYDILRSQLLPNITISLCTLDAYNDMQNSVIKDKKKMTKIQRMPTFDQDMKMYQKVLNLRNEIQSVESAIQNDKYLLDTMISQYIESLRKGGFVDPNKLVPTELGLCAAEISEVDPFVFSKVIVNDMLLDYEPKAIAAILSAFIDFRGHEDTVFDPVITTINEMHDSPHAYNTILPHLMYQWCDSDVPWLTVIAQIKNKSLFIGDFIRAALRLIIIAHELGEIASKSCKHHMMEYKLVKVCTLVGKHIVVAESLYL